MQENLHLRETLDRLSEAKETQAERLLRELRQSSDRARQAAQAVIQEQRTIIQDLEQRKGNALSQAAESELRLLRLVTGMQVNPREEEENTFACTIPSKHGGKPQLFLELKFELVLDPQEDLVEYRHVSTFAEAPAFLKDDFVFQMHMAPDFFGRIYSLLLNLRRNEQQRNSLLPPPARK